jgi:uncharacterized OsmC-like protein
VLIGLNGRKQAGKDTVYARAAHIMDGVVEVERFSFADLLYRSAAAALGITVDLLQAHKSNPMAVVRVEVDGVVVVDQTFREFLQRYGTEAHRDVFGLDFWVDAVTLYHEGRIVFVTDVRFPNEATAIRAAGGAVVEVIGPMGRATDDAHRSEAPLPMELIDGAILNIVRDDGFRALDAQVAVLLRLHLNAQHYSIRVPSC